MIEPLIQGLWCPFDFEPVSEAFWDMRGYVLHEKVPLEEKSAD
jgi:hypothetical protein